MKVCTSCKEEKELTEFNRSYKRPNGTQIWKPRCKVCDSQFYLDKYHSKTVEEKRSFRKRNRCNTPKYHKNYRLGVKYGITIEVFEEMYHQQDGKCYICKDECGDDIHVDHCHKTSKVRKLLCRACNTGLGMLKEDVDILRKCVEYLEEHNDITFDKMA